MISVKSAIGIEAGNMTITTLTYSAYYTIKLNHQNKLKRDAWTYKPKKNGHNEGKSQSFPIRKHK